MKDVASLRKRNLKAWIPVDEEVKVLARHISQAEWEEIRSECSTVSVNGITGKSETVIDEARFRGEIGRRVVEDVTGLEDSDSTDSEGRALPFVVTPENIDLLMSEWTEFRMTVMDTPLSFGRMQGLAKAQLIKN